MINGKGSSSSWFQNCLPKQMDVSRCKESRAYPQWRESIAVGSRVALLKLSVWHFYTAFLSKWLLFHLIGGKVHSKSKQKSRENRPNGILGLLLWNISECYVTQGRIFWDTGQHNKRRLFPGQLLFSPTIPPCVTKHGSIHKNILVHVSKLWSMVPYSPWFKKILS